MPRIERPFRPRVPPVIPVELTPVGLAAPRISGHALVDSGADTTCISQSAATHLALEEIFATTLQGSSGSIRSGVYECRIDLGPLGSIDSWPVMEGNVGKRDIVLIIGCDLMFRWVTTFDGPGRRFVIEGT